MYTVVFNIQVISGTVFSANQLAGVKRELNKNQTKSICKTKNPNNTYTETIYIQTKLNMMKQKPGLSIHPARKRIWPILRPTRGINPFKPNDAKWLHLKVFMAIVV